MAVGPSGVNSCGHIFHQTCLDSWSAQKRYCLKCNKENMRRMKIAMALTILQ